MRGALVCPVVVGRGAEVARLTVDLDEARLGRGGVVAVTGEAGVGKTRLCAEVATVARGRGMTVVQGRGVEAAAPIPYRLLASALLPAFRGPATSPAAGSDLGTALDRLFPLGVDHAVPDGPTPPSDGAGGPAGAADARLVVLEAAARAFRALAGQTGLVAVLDDLQWADAETLAVVDYLADTLSSERVLCVVAARSDEPGPAGPIVERLATARPSRVVGLGRLDERGVDDLVRATLATAALPAGLAPVLQGRAEGLPLAAEQVLADLVGRGVLTRTDGSRWTMAPNPGTPVPEGFRRLVERRLQPLGTQTRFVLACAAQLGREFDWTLLAPATGLDDRRVLVALGEAVTAQLVDHADGGSQLAFRHALLRDGVLAGLSPADRAASAACTAAAVEASTDTPTAEALALAATLRDAAGQHDAAARLLLRLGEDALRRGAIASATETLRQARTLVRDGGLAGDVTERLAVALVRSGRNDEAIAVAAELLATLPDGPSQRVRRRTAQMLLARAAIEVHSFDIGRAALDGAERESSTPEERAAVRALRALLAAEADDITTAAREASAAIADGAGASPEVTCEALYVLARADRGSDDAAATTALERLVALAELHGLPHWRLRGLLELGIIDSLTSGRRDRVLRVRELARETGAVSTELTASVILASPAGAPAPGHTLAAARAAGEEAFELAARFRIGDAKGMALIMIATVDAITGDRRAFDDTVSRMADWRAANPGALGTPREPLAMWALFQDDVPLVLEILPAHAAAIENSHGARSAPQRGFSVLVRAVAGEDVRADCDRIRANGFGGWINRGLVELARAVVTGREGETAEAAAGVDRALADLGTHGVVRHVGMRFAAEGAAVDGWGAPATWLRDCRAFFAEQRMHAMQRACDRLLRRLGEPVPRRGRGDAAVPASLARRGVTSREMDVLLLVGRGLANADIAERLSMSPRTVESHVSRLLAKTGAASRAALVARAGSADG